MELHRIQETTHLLAMHTKLAKEKVMIIPIIVVAMLSFHLGWSLKDYIWVSASKHRKVMVVDGNLYKVKPYSETTGGSME